VNHKLANVFYNELVGKQNKISNCKMDNQTFLVMYEHKENRESIA